MQGHKNFMIFFEFLDKRNAEFFYRKLFKILSSNMSDIAPTGNNYEEDYSCWYNSVSAAIKKDTRQIILIYDNDAIIGFFQYDINNATFLMEEIQLYKEYLGTGLFRRLYAYLFEVIPQNILHVEAYANKMNKRAQNILKHLGLSIVGENRNGRSYHFRGNCREMLNRYNSRDTAIRRMTDRISILLSDCSPSVYLYGSVVLGDFRLGWSDIDILVLSDKQMSEKQAQKLVKLRQTMLAEDPGNLYYRSFEGAILTLDAFMEGGSDRVVYWGTRGEKITDTYMLDSFGMVELIENGVLLYGCDVRSQLKAPSFSELYADIKHHFETIRKYVQKTGRNLNSFGWMLDIARCLYTLRTGKIIAKSAAGGLGFRK